jgi:hypothetical protein
MFSIRFSGQAKASQSLAAAVRSELKRLGDTVYAEVKQRTPVDTGQARAGWRKKVNSNSFTVSNAVPYIEVLDKGRHMTNRGARGSKQAPRGIVGPSLESIKGKN